MPGTDRGTSGGGRGGGEGGAGAGTRKNETPETRSSLDLFNFPSTTTNVSSLLTTSYGTCSFEAKVYVL